MSLWERRTDSQPGNGEQRKNVLGYMQSITEKERELTYRGGRRKSACSSASASAVREDDWVKEPDDDSGNQDAMRFCACAMARSICACSVSVSMSLFGSSMSASRS